MQGVVIKIQSADIIVQNPELQQSLMGEIFQRDLCTVDLRQQPQRCAFAVLRNFCVTGNIADTADLAVEQTGAVSTSSSFMQGIAVFCRISSRISFTIFAPESVFSHVSAFSGTPVFRLNMSSNPISAPYRLSCSDSRSASRTLLGMAKQP